MQLAALRALQEVCRREGNKSLNSTQLIAASAVPAAVKLLKEASSSDTIETISENEVKGAISLLRSLSVDEQCRIQLVSAAITAVPSPFPSR